MRRGRGAPDIYLGCQGGAAFLLSWGIEEIMGNYTLVKDASIDLILERIRGCSGALIKRLAKVRQIAR